MLQLLIDCFSFGMHDNDSMVNRLPMSTFGYMVETGPVSWPPGVLKGWQGVLSPGPQLLEGPNAAPSLGLSLMCRHNCGE